MKFPTPDAALAQHIAVLGKTGSGKTSTAKLIVEHVVERDARVCVLDPVKSDWWGLISSADGKHAGLPFQILGGPHGHVPLHDGAGSAIGELVARGELPLSIIDMADFKAGGPNRFFNAFADRLMRKMRGVLYLVIEEAHEFAPKERSGVGDENMAVYYAKKLATAGRSKGIRLIVCSQRVQSLHNAVLGSCETLIVHRFTAPADQAPVLTWLKGNVAEKAERERIERSLRSLKDGEGWVCTSSAPLELIQFPRLRTFDNSRTPENDDHRAEVVTARVDAEKLRAIIGDAVAQAEADDPKMLRKRIADLEAQLRAASADDTKSYQARNEGFQEGRQVGAAEAAKIAFLRGCHIERQALNLRLAELREGIVKLIDGARASEMPPEGQTMADATTREAVVTMHPSPGALKPATRQALEEVARAGARQVSTRLKPGAQRGQNGTGDTELGSGGKRRILIALAQYPAGLSSRKLSLLIDMSPKGGTWRTYMAELRGKGWISGRNDHLAITDAGVQALGSWEPLPTGNELIQYWRQRLGDSGKRAIFDVVVSAGGKPVRQEDVSEATGIALAGGTWRTYMAELRGLGLIEGRGELRASGDLFG